MDFLNQDIINFINAIINYIDDIRTQYNIREVMNISVDYIEQTDHRYIIGLKIFPRSRLFNIIDTYFNEFNNNLKLIYQSNNYQFINSLTNVYRTHIEIMYTIQRK